MHWQYWPLKVTVPAGTPASGPVTQSWPIVQGHLKAIEIDVPPGHAGLTGIAVTYCGVQIFPWELTGFLIPVATRYTVEWDDEIMATQLAVQAFNTDRYNHVFYLRAEVWPSVGGAPGAVAGLGPSPAPNPSSAAQIAALSSVAA